MKTIKIISAILFFVVISCNSGKNHNAILTDFTKELITMYLDDSTNNDARELKDDIILSYTSDSTFYYLSIYSTEHNSKHICKSEMIGSTFFEGHSILIFGEKESIFFKILKGVNEKSKKRQELVMDIFDPNVWEICLYKDSSICKTKTVKLTIEEDITPIQKLVEKHFNMVNSKFRIDSNEIYQLGYVEHEPKFLYGEDSLRQIISSNFRVKKNKDFGKVAVVVNIVVDKKGKATLRGISLSSNDVDVDNEALRVSDKICKYEFIPASHRNEKVNCIYAITFLKNDVIP